MRRKFLFFVLIFILFFLNFIFLNNYIEDNYWNYGFAYNIVNGLVPYRDFNMVLFPFSSFLTAFVMKIFGDKLIIYYLFSSLVAVLTIYIIDKMNGKNLIAIIIFFMLLIETGGYNFLSLFLLFLIIYLEQKRSNDFLIGLVIGLSIMTNQKMVLLLIPSLLLKNKSKILKRIMSAIIPFQILLIYLFVNKAIPSFLDYTVFGLFDFGSKNLHISLYFFIEVAIIFTIFYQYVKKKDLTTLYCLCFQVITIPIFDLYHLVLGFIPVMFFICYNRGKIMQVLNVIFVFLIGVSIVPKTFDLFSNHDNYFNLDYNNNFYFTIMSERLSGLSNLLFKYYSDHREQKVHFVMADAYYYKLNHKIKIDKFDLTSNGNNGYKGNQKLIEMIKDMDDALFIIFDKPNRDDPYDQTNFVLLDYIKENYEKVDDLGNNFYVYRISN